MSCDGAVPQSFHVQPQELLLRWTLRTRFKVLGFWGKVLGLGFIAQGLVQGSVWDSGFGLRVHCSGFSLRFRVKGLGFRVYCSVFRVQFRVQFGIQGLGFRV